ncbi:MAG: CDP-alcohol phosphatidyltransferase family protein [Planctomycetota bacterium]|nr:CDP-alcohol phosphatidyltransferase family protein [Planctomycetota bacterium]
MRRITALPNLLTLANAFCGLLAVAKAIDALVLAGDANPAVAAQFYGKMEAACLLVFLGMVFDALDGKVARLVGGSSEFGAQLDSFSDALTFGVTPALLAKVLIEHEGPLLGYAGHPRLHFIAAAAFALMAILRLARFNLETTSDESSHQDFKGLPSPAAAGAVVSTLLLYLILRRPQLELDAIGPTPVGQLFQLFPGLHVEQMPWWILPLIACLLPLYGALMVSRVRYVHAVSFLTRRGSFFLLVNLVFAAFLLFAAPIPVLFLVFQGFALLGLVLALFRKSKPEPEDPAGPEDELFAHGGRD